MGASITLNAPCHSTMVSGCYPLHYFPIVQYTYCKVGTNNYTELIAMEYDILESI